MSESVQPYSVDASMPRLISILESASSADWTALDKIAALAYHGPRNAKAVSDVKESFTRVLGSVDEANTLIWVLSYEDVDEGLEGFELQSSVRSRLQELATVYSTFMDDLVAIVLSGELDWSKVFVRAYSGEHVSSTIQIRSQLVNGDTQIIETTSRGYARYLNSLATELSTVVDHVDVVHQEDFLTLLREARESISLIEDRLRAEPDITSD